jgi:hypothetical protein
MKFRIIVSYYATRNVETLLALLDSLRDYSDFISVIANTDLNHQHLGLDLDVPIIYNKNIGMNIGAWNRGFQEFPSEDFYIFLQDECFIKADGFIELISKRFKNNPNLGLLGETINKRWDQPWSELLGSQLNSFEAEHEIAGIPSRRVDTYLHHLKRWKIHPGPTARHLRSLIWALPGKIMREIGGFPVGNNKGECIAAEIAVSRKIAELGYKFDQMGVCPFSYFGHAEWRSDGLSKLN